MHASKLGVGNVVLGKGGSGGGNAPVHVHPLAEERFLVTSGRIKVVFDGRPQRASAHSRFWHECDIARSQMDVRFRGKSGRAADMTVMTESDPTRTSAGIQCCGSEARLAPIKSLV
jgi:hypothetical protein